jgi:CheY-like chemotaxis protein
MKILVVEDDENKRLQLNHFLQRAFPKTQAIEARSLQSGLRLIRQDPPALVLLDMTLPNYDADFDEPGGQTHIFGGREFLRQMDRFDIAVPVIVVTQFETFGKGTAEIGLNELDAELRTDHGNIYRGSIYYHAAIHGWEEQLEKLMRQVLDFTESRE